MRFLLHIRHFTVFYLQLTKVTIKLATAVHSHNHCSYSPLQTSALISQQSSTVVVSCKGLVSTKSPVLSIQYWVIYPKPRIKGKIKQYRAARSWSLLLILLYFVLIDKCSSVCFWRIELSCGGWGWVGWGGEVCKVISSNPTSVEVELGSWQLDYTL